MKARLLLVFAVTTLIAGWASAQTSVAPTPDPAKIAEFEKRFAHGKELEQEGQLTEALAVFDGIIAESPEAKGSLQEAGIINIHLNNLVKADEYFEKLHALVPEYPAAIESLIQINQTLKRDVKVERYLKEFRDLHDQGKVPNPYFIRERIPLGQQVIVVTQFFDFMQEPNTVWMAEVFDPNGQLQRRILLNYDPDATVALRAKDPKYATTEVFIWFGHKVKDQHVTEIDAYLEIFALPDYAKFRSAMLTILANPPKPIFTQAVDAPPMTQ